MALLLFIAVIVGLVLRKMTPEERIELFHKILHLTREGAALAWKFAKSQPAGFEEFSSALRERTRWVIVTPALLAMYAGIYLLMLIGEGSLGNERTILEWGGSLGPRTTNGEWWRLVTAMFVHWGLLHLIADIAGLASVGRLMERLVGPAAFACVFFAAGLIAALQNLSAHPVTVTAGASGGIFGVYGLLVATLIWGWIRRSALTIPTGVLKRICPGLVMFLTYHLATEGLTSSSMMWGLGVGLVGGGSLAFGISAHKPSVRRLCSSTAMALGLVVVSAVPLRGMADVTQEIADLIDLEARTAAAYDVEVMQFRKGRQTADALANMAEAIASDVATSRASLAAIKNIPREHQPVVGDALEYLRLREESWRLRVEGLRKGKMPTLQQAERLESEAKTAFAEVEQWKAGRVEQ